MKTVSTHTTVRNKNNAGLASHIHSYGPHRVIAAGLKTRPSDTWTACLPAKYKSAQHKLANAPGSLPGQCQPCHTPPRELIRNTEEVVGPSEAANLTSTKADIYICTYLSQHAH